MCGMDDSRVWHEQQLVQAFLEDDRFLSNPNHSDVLDVQMGDTMYNDSGQEVQRISVVNALPDLIKTNHTECLSRVVPKIREVLHVAEAEMQVAACTAFLQILQKQLMPVQSYTHTFLQSILTGLDSRHADVANAWLETLLDIIELLPKETIKKDVLHMAITRGQLSQPVQSRLACCRILGKIATKFEPFVIKKDILPVVQSLCQDVDYEVRGCMCRELHSVARGIGLEQTKSAILPELVELTNDEESYVRRAGLDTTVSILDILDEDTLVNTIVPLVCKFCQHALNSEDYTLSQVALQLGKLCHSLSVHLTEEQHKWFIDFYKKLCRLGIPASTTKPIKDQDHSSAPKLHQDLFPTITIDFLEDDTIMRNCRQNAAHNFPAMTLFNGARTFKSEFHTIFKNLCTDSCHLVRKNMAAGFHEVVKLLGTQSHILIPDYVTLLNDSSIEVLSSLVTNLPAVLALFVKTIADLSEHNTKVPSLNDITPAILGCDRIISASHHWRLQEQLLSKLNCIPACFSSDHIYQKYVPLLFRKLHTARALPVKLAAIKTILVCLRSNRRLDQRNDICQRLVAELGHAHNYYQRRLFIDVCQMALDMFSRRFIKAHFFEHVVSLSNDRVANVRLRVCAMLPSLRSLMRLPGDRPLLQNFEVAVRRLLSNEKDRDVQSAIEKAVAQIDRMPVQLEAKKTSRAETDLIDMMREEEENKLLDLEEQDQKEEEAKLTKIDKRRENTSKTQSKIPAPKKGNRDYATSGSSVGRSANRMDQKDIHKAPSFSRGQKSSKVRADVSPKESTTSSRNSSACSVSSKNSISSSNANGRRTSTSGPSGKSKKS